MVGMLYSYHFQVETSRQHPQPYRRLDSCDLPNRPCMEPLPYTDRSKDFLPERISYFTNGEKAGRVEQGLGENPCLLSRNHSVIDQNFPISSDLGHPSFSCQSQDLCPLHRCSHNIHPEITLVPVLTYGKVWM